MTQKDAVGLDVALSVLHDRGVVNETATNLRDWLKTAEALLGPLTFEHPKDAA